MNEKFKEKVRESISSVLPISVIILIICLFIVPIGTNAMTMFILGALLLIVGMGFFSLGSEMSMSVIGERIGAHLSRTKNIWFIAFIGFILGTITTIAEPDLQVLAAQITDVPNFVLILTVGIGVGVFLSIAMLRIVFGIKLSRLLVFFYLIVFIISFFVPAEFLPLSFDSGGVTTGPLTVPFIVAFGIGIASVRISKDQGGDSFGLVALCSIGPIIAVLVLGLLYNVKGLDYVPTNELIEYQQSTQIGTTLAQSLKDNFLEVLESLVPLAVFFFLYSLFALKVAKQEIKKVAVGVIYTLFGIAVFLTGVKLGFLPVGTLLGERFGAVLDKKFMIPLMMLVGYFIVNAEPAVRVLVKQVHDITDGMVNERILLGTLSVGMMIALILSLFRAWYGIPLYCFIIPGYILALGLSFFAPEVFTSIAFDSGGVASGPLTASFLLPLIIGVCETSNRTNINVMQDAFGLVALVALMPLITIQVVGIMYKYKHDKYFEDELKERLEASDDIVVFPKKA